MYKLILWTSLLLCGAVSANDNTRIDTAQSMWQQLREEGRISEAQYQREFKRLDIQRTRTAVLGPVGTASISGQGTDVDTSAPLTGLLIYLYNADTNAFVDSQNTDGSGNFSFTALAAGNYYLVTSSVDDNYIDAMWASTGLVQCTYCQPNGDAIIALADAEVRNGVDFPLTEGATITGQMVDQADGSAVTTLQVSLFKPSDETFNYYVATLYDGLGGYSVPGVPEGDYVLYLEPSEGNMHIPEIYNNTQCNGCVNYVFDGVGTPVTLTNGATTAGIDYSLEFGASISGVVYDNDSFGPLQELGLIMLFNESNYLLASHILYGLNYDPLADGTYTVGGLLPGSFFVQGGDLGREFHIRELYDSIDCPWSGCDRGGGGDAVVLSTGQQKIGVHFLLNHGGKISGTVTDALSGLPIDTGKQEYIQVYDSSGRVVGGGGILSDGSYITARALPAGTYSVRTGSMFTGDMLNPYVGEKYDAAGNIDCPGLSCDLTAVNVVVNTHVPGSPGSGLTSGIDFALNTGFAFSGTITELGSSTPIPDVHVLVYNSAGVFANWTTTDVNGDFTVTGLPAGTYYALTNNGSNLPFMGLRATESGGWIDILFDGIPCPGSACDVTTGTPIVLGTMAPEGGTSYDISLGAGGTIEGRISHLNTQAPVPGVLVNVYHSSGAYYGSYETGTDGRYETVGLPDGTYYLTTSFNGLLLDIMYGGAYCIDGNCDPLDADPLVISGGATLNDIDMVLKPDLLFGHGF